MAMKSTPVTFNSVLLGGPEVLQHLSILVVRVGRAEGEDLRAVRARLHPARRVAGHADGVQLAELDDVVAGLDAGAARDDDVDLLLLPVLVAEGEAEVGGELEVAASGVRDAKRFGRPGGRRVS